MVVNQFFQIGQGSIDPGCTMDRKASQVEREAQDQ